MMLGEPHRPNPTVHVPPWFLHHDSTAEVYSPFPLSGVSVSSDGNANGADFNGSYYLHEAQTTLQRYLPSNETDPDSQFHPRLKKPGLLILGKQAINDDCNQPGQMVTGLPNWFQGTFASKVVLDKEKQVVTVDKEVYGGLETLCLDFPTVNHHRSGGSKQLVKLSLRKMISVRTRWR
ncbi:hypothetical protein ACFXTO_025216 [Malus domestica]